MLASRGGGVGAQGERAVANTRNQAGDHARAGEARGDLRGGGHQRPGDLQRRDREPRASLEREIGNRASKRWLRRHAASRGRRLSPGVATPPEPLHPWSPRRSHTSTAPRRAVHRLPPRVARGRALPGVVACVKGGGEIVGLRQSVPPGGARRVGGASRAISSAPSELGILYVVFVVRGDLRCWDYNFFNVA